MSATIDAFRPCGGGWLAAILIVLALAVMASGLMAMDGAETATTPQLARGDRCVVWVWPHVGGWLQMYPPLPCADAAALARAVGVAIQNGSRPDLARVVVTPEGMTP